MLHLCHCRLTRLTDRQLEVLREITMLKMPANIREQTLQTLQINFLHQILQIFQNTYFSNFTCKNHTGLGANATGITFNQKSGGIINGCIVASKK